MVDESNAFNSLNRQVALHNLPRPCPALARVFVNTYSSPIRLFVSGGGKVLSAEGTCQGDPLAMAIYAVAISPLVKNLAQVCPNFTQLWYADDDSAADWLQPLRTYWDELKAVGPGYGYHPNPSKTVLVVKADVLDRARDIFGGTGIRVTCSGFRYLGGGIGTRKFCHGYLSELAGKWADELRVLAVMAKTQPHAAYTETLEAHRAGASTICRRWHAPATSLPAWMTC